MATLAQLGEALRRADAAGNVEDARKLAAAYAAMKAQQAAAPVDLAAQTEPPAGVKPGSREYADWAAARARAGKRLPQVSPAPPEDVTRSLGAKAQAAIGAGFEAIPIAGPAAYDALVNMRAAAQRMTPEEVRKESGILREANPMSTLAGEVTGTVAPFVLAATVPVVSTILGVDVAAPLVANIALGAGSQKAISYLDTLARGGDPNAPIDIAGVDITPSSLAGIAGAAGPVIGKVIGAGASKLGETVVDPLVRAFRGVTGQADEAAQAAIARTVAADAAAGSRLSAADEAAALAAGQPIINADRFGTSTRTLARTAANADPQAREMLSEFVQDRFLTQNDRAANWITRNTGAPTNIYAVQQNLTAAAKGVNNAAYRTAYSQPEAASIWTPEIEQLMESENFRKAIRTAVKSINEEAALQGHKALPNPFVIDPKTGAYRLRLDASGNPIEPSLEFWDHVQRQLRQKASNLAQQGKGFDAGQVYRARQQLNDVLDATVPEFATARGGAARWFGAEDALEAGQKFVTMKPSDMDAAMAAFAKFSRPERRLFAAGFSASLLNKIGSTPDSVNVINKVFGSPHARAQIEMVLGPKAAAELEPFLRVENAMQLTKQAVQGGSNTVQQLLALGIRVGGSNAGIGYGTGAAFGGLDPRNWGSKAWTAALLGAAGKASIGAIGKKIDQNVMQSIARLLASEAPKLIEQAVRNASRGGVAADALKAIENGLSMLVRGLGAGAASDAALEGTTQ